MVVAACSIAASLAAFTASSRPAAHAQVDGSWTRSIDPGDATSSRAIAHDASGSIYVAGYRRETSTSSVAFVRKYDPTGQELWTREFGAAHTTEARALAVDSVGDVLVAGGVEGDLMGQAHSGFTDVFVRKYDAAGDETWTREFGAARDAVAYAVAVDAGDNVAVAGFASGALPRQTRWGYRDAFVREYDRDGTELWTRQFGSLQPTEARGLAAGVDGQWYVVGTTLGALPGQTATSSFDAFVRAYDPGGVELWTRQLGSPELAVATSAAAAPGGGVYVAGFTDPGGAFVGRYASTGEMAWMDSGARDSRATGLGVDISGTVYVAGQTDVTRYDPAGGPLGSLGMVSQIVGVWGIGVEPNGAVELTGDATDGAFVTRLLEDD